MAKENVAETTQELKTEWNPYGNDMIEKSGQMDSEPVKNPFPLKQYKCQHLDIYYWFYSNLGIFKNLLLNLRHLTSQLY